MRISYLFNSSLPSSNPGSIQVANMCSAMTELSHDVNIIVPKTGLDISISKFYGLKKTPKIKQINFFKKFPLGINYYLFSIISIIYAIFIKTDLYITRNYFTLYLLTLLRKKTIIEIHDDLSSEGRIIQFIFKNFDIFNNRNIIKIVAISKGVENFLINELNVNPNKIQILSSVSDLKFKFKKLVKKKCYNVGYFGSLEKSKGSQFLVELSKLDKNNNYFIYGGNKLDAKKLYNKYKSSNLKIHQTVEYSKLSKYISEMDVLVIPSNKFIIKSLGGVGNISKYTSPMKLFDYLASGKIIITSDLKVYKEILTDNKNCIMIKNLNKINWLNTINQIKFNIEKINKIKLNAFNLSKKYSYKKRAQKLLKL